MRRRDRLTQIDEHMARGNEIMARSNEVMDQNRKAFAQSEQRFIDLGNVLREVNLRNERVLGGLSAEIRRNGDRSDAAMDRFTAGMDRFAAVMDRMAADRIAEREAFFRGLGRLLGDEDPPPASAA